MEGGSVWPGIFYSGSESGRSLKLNQEVSMDSSEIPIPGVSPPPQILTTKAQAWHLPIFEDWEAILPLYLLVSSSPTLASPLGQSLQRPCVGCVSPEGLRKQSGIFSLVASELA